MATNLKSQQEFYDDFKNETQNLAPDLTDFSEGAINDIEAGVVSSAARELTNLTSSLFRKGFFATSDGPEVTGGDDDLQTLAVDHFGDAFARPQQTNAVVTVTFSRTSFIAGSVSIPTGTIVKTKPDSTGTAQRFTTLSDVLMGPTTLSINAAAQALSPGPNGNVDPGKITDIEHALSDPSITVTNNLKAAGGAVAQDDATYRQTITNLIQTLKGGTNPGIEAKAKTIPGITTATVIEGMQTVIGYDIATGAKVGSYFRIPKSILYVADVNGSASDALVSQVLQSLVNIRASGVSIAVKAATARLMDWVVTLTFNPAGPNFSVLENDATQITDSMSQYIKSIPIGTGFNRADARKAILLIWGPNGTGDLTDLTNIDPVGDIAPQSFEKLVPRNIGTV